MPRRPKVRALFDESGPDNIPHTQIIPRLTRECFEQPFSTGGPSERSYLASEGWHGLSSTPGEGTGGKHFAGFVDIVESIVGLDLDGDGQKGHGHSIGLVDGLEAVTGNGAVD